MQSKLKDLPAIQQQYKTAILAPIFRRVSNLELTGQLPLVDVFNRVLRSRSMYQLEFRQRV